MTWVVQGLNSAGARVFSSPKHPGWLWDPPTSYSVVQCFLQWGGVNCPEHEVGHSLLRSTDVKNEWRTSCTLSWHGQGQLYVCLTLQYEITMCIAS